MTQKHHWRTRQTLARLVGPGAIVAPGVAVHHNRVSTSTLSEYMRRGWIERIGPRGASRYVLTAEGAALYGWEPPKPGVLIRALKWVLNRKKAA